MMSQSYYYTSVTSDSIVTVTVTKKTVEEFRRMTSYNIHNIY